MATEKGKYTKMTWLMIDERDQRRCTFCSKQLPKEYSEKMHKRCAEKQQKIDADLGRYRS